MEETKKDLGEEIISELKKLNKQLDGLMEAFGELKNGKEKFG